MASYIEHVLASGENIIHTGSISLWSQIRNLALGLVLVVLSVGLSLRTSLPHNVWLVLFGLGLVFWVVAWLRCKSTELAITNKRVIAKFGLISRRTLEINLAKVESIQVEQGVLGRILSFGSLVIAGVGESQKPILFIADPLSFRRKFVEAQEALKAR